MDIATIQQSLKTINYPGFSRDITSFGVIKNIVVEQNNIEVTLLFLSDDNQVNMQIYQQVKTCLLQLAPNYNVNVSTQQKAVSKQATGAKQTITGVKHIIAISSGKGGVGKSTLATNLAAGLAANGARVGLCDCDLYGPSIGHMFGAKEQLYADHLDRIIPLQKHGVQLVSMALLTGEKSPVIVRGPLASRYIQQFLYQVNWGNLDYLILDLPPGTGDIQLTLVQNLQLTGAVIVSSPQQVALIDAKKAIAMFQKVAVPIIGGIENMAWFTCNHGEQYPIFGEGGMQKLCSEQNIPLLGKVPLDMPLLSACEQGVPLLSKPVSEKTTASGKALQQIIASLEQQYRLAEK